MTKHVLSWIGLGGVAPNDNPDAHRAEAKLHSIMIGIALLSIPAAFVHGRVEEPWVIAVAEALQWLVFASFTAELAWMMWLSANPFGYVVRNWLNLAIVLFAGFGLAGWTSDWFAVARLARLALVGLLLARAFSSVGGAFTARSVPAFIGLSVLMLIAAGSGFYILEPTVQSFGDGLWLAFVTGSTVGYGDFVPTSTPARIFAVLMVLVGFALLSIVTASISAFLIGEDEKRLRREMHQDIRELREEVRQLRRELSAKDLGAPRDREKR